MRLIGDVHGKYLNYKDIIKECDESIVLGDFGFDAQHTWLINDPTIDKTKHKILFGNHDYIPYRLMNYSLGDFGLYQSKFFFVRGAESIDQEMRIEGKDWFREEQLTYREGKECIELYEKTKPSIVLTHDIPENISKELFEYRYRPSITAQILQQMLEIHKPDLWFFGHHHKSITSYINGTFFHCLDELEYFDI